MSGEVTTSAALHQLLFDLDIRKYDADTRTEFYFGPGIDWRSGNSSGDVDAAPWFVSETI